MIIVPPTGIFGLHAYSAFLVSRRRSNSNQRISGRPPSGRGDADCTFDWLLIPGMYALSFYVYVQNDFGLSKLFWMGPNCFGQVQIILVRFKLDFLD